MLEVSYDYSVLRLQPQTASLPVEAAEAEQAAQELSCALSAESLQSNLISVAKEFQFTKFQTVMASVFQRGLYGE